MKKIIPPLLFICLALIACGQEVRLLQCPFSDQIVEHIEDCPQYEQNISGACPKTCDDNAECTRDYCSEATKFICMHDLIRNCCESSKDCDRNNPYCLQKKCVACVIDKHCPKQTPYCVENKCKNQINCNDAKDCPKKIPFCEQEICQSLRCTTAADCPENRPFCVRNICYTQECEADMDCAAGEGCRNSVCLQRCEETEECAAIDECIAGLCETSQLLEALASCEKQIGSNKQICQGITLSSENKSVVYCRDLYGQDTPEGQFAVAWCVVGYAYEENTTEPCNTIQTEGKKDLLLIQGECIDMHVDWKERLHT